MDAARHGTLTTAGGSNAPTVFTFTTPIQLTPGNHGIQLAAVGFAHSYTNGTGTNQVYTTAELTMNCGAAQNLAQGPGPVFTPRVFNGSLHYQSGPGWASHIPYGTGCGEESRSFYESFSLAASFDLANTAFIMVDTGSQYLVVPAGIYAPPPAGATTLTLADDAEATVTLATPFPSPTGPVGSLVVCSNGFVSLGGGNGTAATPSASQWLASTNARFGDWHDFDPAAAGGGRVKFHQSGGVAYVTWDGVYDRGSTVPNTFQLQFDTGSGSVTFVFGAMSGFGGEHLCGYAARGPSRDLGSFDLSVRTVNTFSTGAEDRASLQLVGGQRPVVGTTASLTVREIPLNTALGFQVFSFSRNNPGMPLDSFGMPTCFAWVGLDASLTLAPTGSTTNLQFALPNDPGLSGLAAYSQTAMLSAGVNTAGILTSNGLTITVGVQ